MTKTIPMIADVLNLIEADQDLALQRRKDICSGVRTICRVLHLQPESTPADTAYFQERLAGLTPAGAGLSKTRLRNCKGYLEVALAHARLLTHRRRGHSDLLPEFRALLAKVEGKWEAIKLTGFFRFASELGIEPEAVSDAAFDAHLESLRNSLMKDPRTANREARKLWNKYAQSAEGWPRIVVKVPNYATRYTLAPETLPQSLWDDCDAYLDSRRVKEGTGKLEALLEQMAKDPDWRPDSRKTIKATTANRIEYQVLQFASALVIEKAVEPHELQGLADLVRPDRFARGLTFFVRRAKSPANPQVHGIAMTMYSIAKLWVGLPDPELAKLATVFPETRPDHDGLPDRVRFILAPFRDPERVKSFLELPDRVLAEAEKLEHPSELDAHRVAAALWIKIAQRAPLRISNIVGIDLEKNLIRSHSGKSAKVSLFFPANEVKNARTLEIPLPDSTVRFLDIFLKKYRPLIVKGPCTWLFPARKGGRKNPCTMAQAIKRLTNERLGFPINPHSFRHIAAKLYLTAHPGRYADVQLLLGHKKLETTINYYCDLEDEEIFRHFDATLLGLEAPAVIQEG